MHTPRFFDTDYVTDFPNCFISTWGLFLVPFPIHGLLNVFQSTKNTHVLFPDIINSLCVHSRGLISAPPRQTNTACLHQYLKRRLRKPMQCLVARYKHVPALANDCPLASPPLEKIGLNFASIFSAAIRVMEATFRSQNDREKKCCHWHLRNGEANWDTNVRNRTILYFLQTRKRKLAYPQMGIISFSLMI